jgi:CBS domain-containing membrane protein
MAKKIAEIMSRRLETLGLESTIGEAHKRMREKSIRHLPVIEPVNQKLLGLISDRDIKKFMSPFIGSQRETSQDRATLDIQVGKVMVKSVVTANPEDEVRLAIEKMLPKKLGCLPIVDENERLIGIVTNVDLIKLLLSML